LVDLLLGNCSRNQIALVIPRMHFQLPNFPCEFEIPDDWLVEAGLRNFTASTPSFCSTTDVTLVPIREIEPPLRLQASPNDFHGFDRRRMISVLQGIVAGAEIEAVPLIQLPELDDRLARTPQRYRTYGYRVQDGFHRFYGSIAAGFECLPALITTVPDLVQFCQTLGWCE
jgi:hypothetical protein